VINVNSVNAYNAAYPAMTTPVAGYYISGQTVYLRAVVSDPFGSYDIVSLPKITIKDANNNFLSPPVTNVDMTYLVSATTTSTKTYEYAYSPVPVTGPTGTWTVSVTAVEGTEGTVSDLGTGTFRVQLLPNLLVLKSVQTVSDPFNGVVNPKAIPGAVMSYTVIVTNQGTGATDPDTVVITDPIPANTSMCVSSTCSNPPVTGSCANGCGLTYNYATDVTYFDQFDNSYTPAPDAAGYDPLARKVRVNPKNALNGSPGAPYPQFTLQFLVRVE